MGGKEQDRCFSDFGHWDFIRVSGFGIRIFNLTLLTNLTPLSKFPL